LISQNKVVWIPDSKTPNGVAELPLTDLAVEAFAEEMRTAGDGPYLFPARRARSGTSHLQNGLGGGAQARRVWISL